MGLRSQRWLILLAASGAFPAAPALASWGDLFGGGDAYAVTACSLEMRRSTGLRSITSHVRFPNERIPDVGAFTRYAARVEESERRLLAPAYESGALEADFEKFIKEYHAALTVDYTGYMRGSFNRERIEVGQFVEELAPGDEGFGPTGPGAGFWFYPINELDLEAGDAAGRMDALLGNRPARFQTRIEGIDPEAWPNNERYPATGHSTSSTMHSYPLVSQQRLYVELAVVRLREARAKMRAGAPPEQILASIADFYQVAINGHFFRRVNNTPLMSIVNFLLEKNGLSRIPHGILDYEAMALDSPDFRRLFIERVRRGG
jgi:hypothetical protein